MCLRLPVPLSRETFSANLQLIIGFFCGKWLIKIRHPIGLRHPVLLSRESCHTCEWVMSYTCDSVMSPMWMSHVTHFPLFISTTFEHFFLYKYVPFGYVLRAHIYTCIHIHIYTYICMNICIYIYAYSHMTSSTYLYVYPYAHIHIYIHISICIYTYTYTHICVCIHISVCMRKYMYIHTYLYTNCVHSLYARIKKVWGGYD